MLPKLSIITAIHNGFSLNKIFIDSLKKYTFYTYELIIIDNVSKDESANFFKKNGATVITNSQNYSYPVCQNQGIEVAKGEFLCFLNNDIIVSPNWDKHLIEIAQENSLDILSASGIENMGTFKKTQAISRKWKKVKNLLSIFSFSEFNLKMMHKIMYGNWEKYCNNLYKQNGTYVVEGIVGDNVILTRKAIEKIGLWDERLQQADFDLFMRAKKRAKEFNDIKPCHIALGVYIHHFGRMTLKYAKQKPTPFKDKENLIILTDKWSEEEIKSLHPNNATLNLKN